MINEEKNLLEAAVPPTFPHCVPVLVTLYQAAALFVLTVMLAVLFVASRGQTASTRSAPSQFVALPNLSQQRVHSDDAFVLSSHAPSD